MELDARKADRKIHEDALLWLEVVEVHGEQVGDEEVDKVPEKPSMHLPYLMLMTKCERKTQ